MMLQRYSMRLKISRNKRNHCKTSVRTYKPDQGGIMSGLLGYRRARAALPLLFQRLYRKQLTSRRPRYWIDPIAHYSQHQDEETSCTSLWLTYTTPRNVPTSFTRPGRRSGSKWAGWSSLSTQITLHRWPELEQVTTRWDNNSEGFKELSMASSTRLASGSPTTTRSGSSPHQEKRRFTSLRISPHRGFSQWLTVMTRNIFWSQRPLLELYKFCSQSAEKQKLNFTLNLQFYHQLCCHMAHPQTYATNYHSIGHFFFVSLSIFSVFLTCHCTPACLLRTVTRTSTDYSLCFSCHMQSA